MKAGLSKDISLSCVVKFQPSLQPTYRALRLGCPFLCCLELGKVPKLLYPTLNSQLHADITKQGHDPG